MRIGSASAVIRSVLPHVHHAVRQLAVQWHEAHCHGQQVSQNLFVPPPILHLLLLLLVLIVSPRLSVMQIPQEWQRSHSCDWRRWCESRERGQTRAMENTQAVPSA